ncbi:E3 ubiquitin-protein ligase DMA2 [Cladobotryum mycophilum]|uniref:E3 ubiquitin-protein ligase DMA2 n=1 Tax=Cladobotryum mycophilum TaxID=491253 RepID=A0ABR0SZH6_9HYPO
MFTQPLSPPITGPQTSATPRQSRLRGLSYLRNYTQNHLLSRETHHSNSTSSTTSSNSSVVVVGGSSPPGNSSTSSASSAAAAGLTRSVSYTPAATTTTVAATRTVPNSASNPNRLTLVSTTPDFVRAHSTSPAPASPPLSETDEPGLPQPSTSAEQIAETSTAADADAAAATTTTADDSANMTRDRADGANGSLESAPSIRFSAYYDPRSTRPSLSFPPSLALCQMAPSHAMANMPGNQPSAAPVGFKSKVVSRRHCEFWYENGKWFIKDVKSSSGTFLNHIRLSPPQQESKAFPVNDGDIVQLGIDFKGGEEMIFRCVKMRLELNRGWQNKPNTFNMAAHKRLRTMAAGNNTGGSNATSQDCSICLNSIAPCQSLFVAPCSHTWHFKCVRSLLTSPQYPIFICPNCRAGADLEADVEEPDDEWQRYQEQEEKASSTNGNPSVPETAVPDPIPTALVHDIDIMDLTVNISPADSPAASQRAASHATTEPLPIRNPSARIGRGTPSPPSGAEGPITPRNDAGPWVFDGRGGRRPATAAEMRSLDAAADLEINGNITSDDSSR